MRYYRLATPAGNLIMGIEGKQFLFCKWESTLVLRKYTFSMHDAEAFMKKEELPPEIRIITENIDKYFRGELKTFPIPHFHSGTPFQRKVWEEIAKIPYGTVISYKELAGLAGREKAYRAVAGACGANPFAIIIPCHRVVGSGGNTGGYTGGLDKKLFLLNHETCNSES